MELIAAQEAVAVVLAAGKSRRMASDKAKVLISLNGRPMITYVLSALTEADVSRKVLVIGHQANLVRESLKDNHNLEYAFQASQLGTGHAVGCCRDLLRDHPPCFISTFRCPIICSGVGRCDARFYGYRCRSRGCRH